jgi:hypothetical protein
MSRGSPIHLPGGRKLGPLHVMGRGVVDVADPRAALLR